MVQEHCPESRVESSAEQQGLHTVIMALLASIRLLPDTKERLIGMRAACSTLAQN